MPSVIPGYEYDIFISYRQKDNKYDGWVSTFVDHLTRELEATFKDDVSLYFDLNPHDGLTDTHDVAESLRRKLQSAVFIPVLSRTYCDPGSFAWEHEFKAFQEFASRDPVGLKVTLNDGNVASRVLPVVIHALSEEDVRLVETVTGGFLRGIEFIYSERGVNRPLQPDDDHTVNLNRTRYRNQVNKLALAIHDIILGMKNARAGDRAVPLEPVSVAMEKAAEEKSIIVLPFENMSPDPDQEYFSDGLTEEIITDLSRIPGLLVISRSSAMTFKGTRKSIAEIARSANVRYVLEGSVRKSGDRLRITAQLIQAERDVHLWAEKYDGSLEDVFAIQEKVSGRIVEALKGKLTHEDHRQLTSRWPAPSIGVYEAYARASYEFWKTDPGSLNRSLRILEDTIRIHGEQPLLLSGLGAVHWQFYHMLGDQETDHLAPVQECAGKLFALDPDSAPGHRLSSYLELNRGNSDLSILHLRAAIRSDPGDTESMLWLSYLLSFHAGQPSPALPVAERFLSIDPLHPVSKLSLLLLQWISGNADAAIRGLEEMHRLDAYDRFLSFYLGHLLAWQGRSEECLALSQELYRSDPDEGMGQALRFLALALNGMEPEAREAFTPWLSGLSWNDFHLPWLIAEGYSLLGDRPEALRWLERTIDRGFFNYPLLHETDPLLAGIRGEPRFKELMEKIRIKWQDFGHRQCRSAEG